jgi:hypothetical protein
MDAGRFAWVRQFAVHLKRLRPDVDPTEARDVGLAAFEHTAGLAPEDAAKIYAEKLGRGEVGSISNRR